MQREKWLDAAKGLAIILVVLGHCLNHFDNEIMHRMCEIIYLFHMPLFVLLSGYSFYWVAVHNSFSKNIINNAAIYVIQSVVYILFNIALQGVVATSNHYSARDLLTFPVIPVAHFWYIQAIIIYYCIFFVYERFVRDIRIRRVLEAVTVLVIFPINRLTDNETLTRICYHILFFAIGFFLHAIIVNALRPKSSNGASCGFPDLKLMSFLGVNSLWIYIFHPYATAFVKAALSFSGIENAYAGLGIMLIAGIGLPLVLRLIMQKTGTAWIVTRPVSKFPRSTYSDTSR